MQAASATGLASGSRHARCVSPQQTARPLGIFSGNPYNIPLGAGLDYWGLTAPNTSFAFPAGQAISRTTYSALFSLVGTTYGIGDGSTTFNLPDKTGRVSAMKEAVGTRLTTVGSGVDGGTMGAHGGVETETLTLAQLPTGITVTGTVTVTAASATSLAGSNTGCANINISASAGATNVPTSSGGFLAAGALSGSNTLISNNTNGNAHPNTQPTIICNYIIRII